MNKGELLKSLRSIGCIKHSDEPFTLKSGQQSNLYVDLRLLTSHPDVLQNAAQWMADIIPENCKYDYLAGVVAGGIPLATMMSNINSTPMIMVRTERKKHGMGKLIEGIENPRNHKGGPIRIMLVEDVINTGISVEETIRLIRSDPLGHLFEVVGAVCLLDRGSPQSRATGLENIFSVFNLSDLTPKTFAFRRDLAFNPHAKQFFDLMITKKSNLIWSADIEEGSRMLDLLELVSPHIVAVKVHFDCFDTSFDSDRFIRICSANKVIIISDRKYADIEATVRKQVRRGIYERLCSSATVHPIAGPGTMNALADAGISSIVVAEMSCSGSVSLGAERAFNQAERNIMGVVCQSTYSNGVNVGCEVVYMTPGVHESATSDGLNQNYRTCHQAICRDMCDAVIVGRAISEAPNVVEAAKVYQESAWKAVQSLGLS